MNNHSTMWLFLRCPDCRVEIRTARRPDHPTEAVRVETPCYECRGSDIPRARYFNMEGRMLTEAPDYECEDCIGMKDHGCFCKAMGAHGPGGQMLMSGVSND